MAHGWVDIGLRSRRAVHPERRLGVAHDPGPREDVLGEGRRRPQQPQTRTGEDGAGRSA